MSRLTKCSRIMLLVALFFAVGASRSLAASFKSDWKTALKSTPTNSIVGAWEGEWKSIAHKVHGPLKCVIKDLGNGQYEAHFYAQFHWFHFTYAAKLVAEKSADQTSLKGEADLGWMGGLYKYAGQASPDKYFSSYKSPVENGVLELQRPKTA